MRWPKIDEVYGAVLKATPVFQINDENGQKRWKALHSRVIEHVCSSLYLVNPLIFQEHSCHLQILHQDHACKTAIALGSFCQRN